ncbi:MAG: PorV/PorQ family protein [candidate division Zixibacteria bacterium]|nr:PorV/PorQ family protein [candidate division Zixibacteria bacterium]
MRKLLIFGVAFLVLLGSAVSAGEFSKVGSVGAQFLKIGVGSRYQGLGEASVAVVNDAYSLYWNPAGLAYIEGSDLTFTNVNWVSDISLNYIGFGTHVEDFGNIGFAATLLTMGDMTVTTVENPNGTGETFSASSFALTVGYAKLLTNRLAFGASIKYIYETIHNESASGIAFDFGTQLNTGFRSLRIGMNISNMGSSMKFDGPDLNGRIESTNGTTSDGRVLVDSYDLPLTFRLGMAYDLINSNENRWTLSFEAKHPNDDEQQASIGGEYSFQEKYFLRAGYKLNYSEQGVTLGAGLQSPLSENSDFIADYSWADFGRLNDIHRFSIGFKF